ncbi:3-hydroxyacyl-CoA dehydrogenase family protein [Deltaproteobacteria bacterium OttesenSCG-928-K17]|nr:3-hydroxyacyl-CoA dehydrogenase family protein [Deltaproteobacteria bacterium OttesenSCG-928-K17]
MTVIPGTKIAVFGGGIMGQGICQALLMGGYDIALCDISPQALDTAKAHIKTSLEDLHKAELLKDPAGALGRLSLTTDRAEALKGAVMLMEVIFEDLEVKRSFFAECEQYADAETIFATNTSHLNPEDIFSQLKTRHRAVAAHWFNPAHLIPLVEVAKLSYTDEKYWLKTVDILNDAGKVAVAMKKPVQGLIINRIFSAMAREACYLNDQGVADVEEIDKAIMATIGYRQFCIGVFKTMDLGNLTDWHPCLELLLPLMDNSTTPPASMTKMLNEGRTGIRAGQGYYKYDVAFGSAETDKEIRRRDEMIMKLLKLQGKQW